MAFSIQNYTQEQLVGIVKDSLTSYNAAINVTDAGTYWDITANAIAAAAKEAIDRSSQVAEATDPSNASSELLETWATSIGLAGRKTGSYASGSVKISASSYPVTIALGDEFSIGPLAYASIKEYTLTEESLITVQANNTGAEYNVPVEKDMSNSIGVTATSQGLFGGSGVETDDQLLDRILINIRNRKTDGRLTDYVQQALELYPRANAETLFLNDLIPYGVRVNVTNTVEDFATAAKNNHINEIGLSSSELTTVQNTLANFSTVTAYLEASTTNTQQVSTLSVYVYTSDNTLSASEEQEVREALRVALMKFDKDVLAYSSLFPEFPSYVESYFFEYFIPIDRTAPMMDSTAIGVSLATESTRGALANYFGGGINV